MSRPQHSKAVRLRLAPAVIGLGAVVALSGCAAGQQAETSKQVAAVFGANADVKNMAIRNATMTFPQGEPFYPKGATAPIDVVLVNEALHNDRLVKVSSSYAASAKISGQTVIPGGTRLYSDGVPPGSTPQVTNDPSSGPADPPPVGPVKKPQVNIALVGLTQTIRPGTTIPVTFTFAKAGSVTAHVPIGPSGEPRPEHGSPSGHGGSGEQAASGEHSGQSGHSGQKGGSGGHG